MNIRSPRYPTTWHIKQIPVARIAHHSLNAQTSASPTQRPAPSSQQCPERHAARLIPSQGTAPRRPRRPICDAAPALRCVHAARQSLSLVPGHTSCRAPICGAPSTARLCFSTCKKQNSCYQEAKQLHSPSRTILNQGPELLPQMQLTLCAASPCSQALLHHQDAAAVPTDAQACSGTQLSPARGRWLSSGQLRHRLRSAGSVCLTWRNNAHKSNKKEK